MHKKILYIYPQWRKKGIQMMGKIAVLCWLALLGLSADASSSKHLLAGNFSQSNLTGWETKVFAEKTSYRLTKLEEKWVLAAESQNSASCLIKKMHVDIEKYPYLNWSWRIENRLDLQNEKIKAGDDYGARIYVVIDGGIQLWKTQAISYVWANGASKGEIWENAFAGKNAMMMAVRDRQDEVSTWYAEKRNVSVDLKSLFGKTYRFIDAVALMTDTDNSHGKMSAYYGDIYFSKN
jgi:hypothetical protein